VIRKWICDLLTPQKREESKYDIQIFIRNYMADFYSLIEVQSISWNNINRIFGNHLNKVKKQFNKNGRPVLRDATFYSVVISKINKDGKGDGMFDFYNSLFYSLSLHLDESQKKLIHKTLYNILVEVDKNYLNFIGELAVLNAILKTKQYEFKNVEEKIKFGSNVSADFLFIDKQTRLEQLVEVVSIHLEDKELKNEQRIVNHIKSKVTEKINNKFIGTDRPYLIQPVIWTRDIDDIDFLKKLHKRGEIEIQNMNSPFVYYTFLVKTYEHHFERLSD